LRLRALCEGQSLAAREITLLLHFQRNLIFDVIYGQTFAVNITFSARLQPQFALGKFALHQHILHANSKLQCM
jgi:hypothetical protein